MFGLEPTPFDMRLVAFRIPVRVHPSFWLGMALFGSNLNKLELIFIWVVCAFFSVLVHELGHALTAEGFGWPTEILLYFGGGLAISSRYHHNTPGRSIAVSIMGPAAGFLLLGQVIVVKLLLNHFHLWENETRFWIFYFLEFMNLYWGLINLLPALPLDGGYILQSTLELMGLRDPTGVALKVGIAVTAAAAYYFFAIAKEQMPGAFMLMFCFQNWTTLQSRR